jgi:hypothetical protein
MRISAVIKEAINSHQIGEACYVVGFTGEYAIVVFENGDMLGTYPFKLTITDPDYLDFNSSGKHYMADF